MTGSMTLLWLVKGTVVLLLAMALTLGLRRAPAGARYVVWLASLAAVLLVPALSTWISVPLPILPATVAANATEPAATGQLGALKVRRIVRNGRELRDEGWLMPMYDVADRLDLANAPRLVVSDDVEMPFACGVLRPTIVLPTVAESWSDERRRVVLFHELAHVRRRDLLGHTVGRVTCALYWFHPLVWSAAKRLRAESERACDDLVLACGGARASDYATHLLDIVTGVRRQGAPATALPMADKKEFEGRMLAILDPSAKRVASSRLQQILVTAGFGALALSTAAVAPTAQRNIVAGPSSLTVAQVPAGDSAPSRNFAAAVRPRTQPSAGSQTRAGRPAPAPAPLPQSAQWPAVRPQEFTREQIVSEWGGKRQVASPDTALLGRILRTDKDAGVRKAAAWALQGRRDGVPLLLERLRVDVDDDVREMSAWALSHMPSDEVAGALTQALSKDASERVRATAAWGLGQMPTRVGVAALEGALNDEDEDVRQRALWALGQQRIETAPKRVVELLQDSDEDVRVMAAWVLGEIRDKSTMTAVRDAFAKERSHEVQEAEFRTLLLLGDRSQALVERAMASDDPEIRARAVRLIAGHDTGAWPWPWPWPEPRPEP